MHITPPKKKQTNKLSKYTLRNTFVRGRPYNAYKNQKIYNKKSQIPLEICLSGVPPIMHIPPPQKKTVKINPQKYVYKGSPL